MKAKKAPARVFAADKTLLGERFVRGARVEVGADGRIGAVRSGPPSAAEPAVTDRLPGRALVPGLVNVHSHAFQRGLRGRGETFPTGAGSFWTWREAMYGLVQELDPPACQKLCLAAFREMRAAGVTSVGEFHYLHHAGSGDDFSFDEAVLAAAAEAGIRIVLLETFYATGGISQSLEPAQRRFRTTTPEIYWRQMEHLAGHLDPALQSLGAVAHSVRAASIETIAELAAEARRRKLVVHMHVEEQRQEIEACVAAYRARPMELLLDRLPIGPEFTAVHGTHSTAGDLARFAATGANLCLCPLTEANLGDGIPNLPAFTEAGGHLALGSDSNNRISLLEEMRWLEYGQRLRFERRGVLRDEAGEVVRGLWRAATLGGARSLGLPVGRIQPGAFADFVSIDLGAPCLAGCDDDRLLTALVLGAGNEVVLETWVGGRREEHRAP